MDYTPPGSVLWEIKQAVKEHRTPLFPVDVQTPQFEEDATFLIFLYCFMFYHTINMAHLLAYPFLFMMDHIADIIYEWTSSYPILLDIWYYGSVNWFTFAICWVVEDIFFHINGISELLALFFIEAYAVEISSEMLSDPVWLKEMPSHAFIALEAVITSPESMYICYLMYVLLSPLIVSTEFIFGTIISDSILGGLILYPSGFIVITFLSVSIFSFFFDVIKSDRSITSELNRWYKNLLIFKILIVYNTIFLVYFYFQVFSSNFLYYKPWIYTRLSEICFLSMDRFSLVSVMFLALFILIFIKIAIISFLKLADLNTVILWTLSIFILAILIELSDVFLVYLGIVSLSLCLYPLIALDKKSQGNAEAVGKYFFLGALASGLMLYGITLVYKETNILGYQNLKNLDFSSITNANSFTISLGIFLIIFGFFFKLSIVPLQNWTPDVYLGSPTVITCFLATIVKFSLYLSFMRFYYSFVLNFLSFNINFKNVLLIFALASIIVGAVGAIDQFKIKRFIGYATINQMGFILLGISLQNVYGFTASYIYLCIYTTLNLIFFFFILNIRYKSRDLVYLSDLVPFFKDNKLTGMVFILLMFSLAGMPPTIGFYMKVLILKSLVFSGHLKLTLLVLYANVASILYYIRIVKIVFFDAEVVSFTDRYSKSARGASPVSFIFFKTPFEEVKSLKEIITNYKYLIKYLIYIVRQIFYYGIILFFISGIWYNWLIDETYFSTMIAYMWLDLGLVKFDSASHSGLCSAIYYFLWVI